MWAEKVKDDAWSWKNVKERLKKIEAYHDEIPDEYREWVNPKPEGMWSSFLVACCSIVLLCLFLSQEFSTRGKFSQGGYFHMFLRYPLLFLSPSYEVSI
jgi:hypothetical protein